MHLSGPTGNQWAGLSKGPDTPGRAECRDASTWLGLEDYLLNQAEADGSRVTVFSGPVLEDTDPVYRGIAIPLALWKVVAFQHTDGHPSAIAYLISQRDLVTGIVRESFLPTPTRSLCAGSSS